MVKLASLSRSADFRRVHGEGTRARRNGLGIVAMDRGDGAPARVGYAVKRSAGGAVTRNRIKRRLRATVRDVGVPVGFDVVVSGDPEVATIPYQELEEKLSAALAAAGVRR